MSWVVDTCIILDVLIGAYASIRSGLLTLNRADFAAVFPDLDIRSPG